MIPLLLTICQSLVVTEVIVVQSLCFISFIRLMYIAQPSLRIEEAFPLMPFVLFTRSCRISLQLVYHYFLIVIVYCCHSLTYIHLKSYCQGLLLDGLELMGPPSQLFILGQAVAEAPEHELLSVSGIPSTAPGI